MFSWCCVQPIGEKIAEKRAKTLLCRNETLGTCQYKLFNRIKGEINRFQPSACKTGLEQTGPRYGLLFISFQINPDWKFSIMITIGPLIRSKFPGENLPFSSITGYFVCQVETGVKTTFEGSFSFSRFMA